MSRFDSAAFTTSCTKAQKKLSNYVEDIVFNEGEEASNLEAFFVEVRGKSPSGADAFIFKLVTQAGLPGYAISTRLYIAENLRGIITQEVDSLKRAAAALMGAVRLLASVRADNPSELARMFKGNWRNVGHIGSLNNTAHLLFESEQLI